jgi:hypothetical protein
MEQLLERLQELPEALQQEALHYLEGFVALHTTVERVGKEHPAAQFYGICADDPIALDQAGIDASLDDDMVGAFD